MIPPPLKPLRCFLAAGFYLFGFFAAAAPANPGWALCTWKSDDGLPNNHVTGLAQTPDGYLWVATFSRPARFDGVQFEDFLLRDFGLESNQKITALQLGRDGLWMGTSHGQIAFLDSKTARVFTNNLPDKVTQTLTEDGEGFLWATYQSGVVVSRIEGGAVASFTTQDGLPGPEGPGRFACSLARDDKGRVWFAKSGHVGIIRKGRFEKLLQLPPVTARLAGARGGGVWICSDGRLLKFSEGKALQESGRFAPSGACAEPSVLFEDRRGGIWIGTSGDGLFHYDGSHFEAVPTSDEAITCLTEDREGNIWVGTESGGLDRLRPRVIEMESEGTGLPFGTVQSLCEATNGTIWATTQNGLLLRERNGAWETLSTNANWPGGRATCVAADKTGAIWIGTKEHELHCWRDGQFTTLSRADGIAGREIHALLSAKNGDVWIGDETPDVVQRLRDGRLDTYQMPPNVRIIRAMAEDAAGNIWIGTSGGKLVRIANGVVSDETGDTTGAALSIRCLYAAMTGALWIGYADEGIGCLKDGHFAHLDSEQDFPEKNMSQIVADDEGWLWFGGDRGIFKARQSELDALAAGRGARANYVRYGQSEGLFSLEANCGDSPGAIRGTDGRLWIPMRRALAIADPNHLRDDSQPPLLIKRVTVDDQTVASYGGMAAARSEIDLRETQAGLRLPPGHHRLRFEFTALSFGAPENVRFRYKLEGFDDNWVDGGTERAVSYSRLAAGDYLFRVTCCNGSGVWNEKEAKFAFAVAPFIWQAWWFRFTTLAALVTVIAALVRYISFRRLRLKLQRLEQQAALDKERSRIARDIHDDLGGRLTEVELMIELAQRTPPEKLNGQMRRISATVQQVGESLDEIVWAVNPRHDTLPRLMDYLGQYAIQFLQTAGIHHRVDFPEEFPQRTVPPETRHNLFLAVKEALNNVARHAQATEARLRVSLAGDFLKIAIEDNGRGFDGAPKDSCADGLENMRRRMGEIGGDFQIESTPGAGTRILLTLRIPGEMRFANQSQDAHHNFHC
jgi:signal transduction histidine kinase/ligand-binding sensor domain-containing protein